jgi:inner membrane protein
VDNICHTLVGVAASRAGLKHKTALATTTLVLASNLPDLDVLAFATGIPAVALRRGWTHGVLAQAVLPLAFAAAVHVLAKRRTHFGWLVALSYIGVVSHVFLDFLNNYGVRLLMPFSNRWFYGDAVFIIDLVLWVLLALGSVTAIRGRRWPAGIGLTLAAAYIAAMLVSARAAHTIVRDRWIDGMGTPPVALMVGPVPIDPLRKRIIVDAGDRYVTGTFSWYPRSIAFSRTDLPKNDQDPRIAAARAQEPDFDAVLLWARFPYWTFEEEDGGTRVTLRDVRFPAGQAGFQATTFLPLR